MDNSIALHLGRQTTPGRHQVPWTPSSTRGEAQETFPSGSEQGLGGRWVPGRARRGQFVPACSASDLGAQQLALRHGLEVSAVSCGRGMRGRGGCRRGSRGPSSAAASSPVLTQLSRKTSELSLGEARQGAPRAPREGRGLPGGARNEGARAHAPCARAILE